MNSSALQPISNTGNNTYNVGAKRAIIEEAKEYGIRETANKHRIRHRLLESWMKKETAIPEKASRNPNAKSINKGSPIKNPEVQHRALMLIYERRSCNLPLKAQQLIDYVLSLDPDFHSGEMEALFSWAYRLLKKPLKNMTNKLKRKRKEIECDKTRAQIETTHRRKVRIIDMNKPSAENAKAKKIVQRWS